jgi:hypothetical protein
MLRLYVYLIRAQSAVIKSLGEDETPGTLLI